ncbi:MAG: S1C family serine protease [Acidimicrobiales bacterium]
MAQDDEGRDDMTEGPAPSWGGNQAPGVEPPAGAGSPEGGAGAWPPPPPPPHGPWAGAWGQSPPPPPGAQGAGYQGPWGGNPGGSQAYGAYPGYPGAPAPGGWPPPPRERRKGAAAALLVAGVLIIGGAGLAVGVGIGSSSGPAATAPPTGSSGTSGSGLAPRVGLGSGTGGSVSTSGGSPSNVAAIARRVDRGLVDINTQLAYQNQEAAGTGMVISSSGEVLTNNHVIEGATAISVTDLGNGRTYRASVVGYDRSDDIAVLQLKNASGLTTVKLGNSSTVRTGQGIVGIGNAGGVGGTPSVAGGSVTSVGQSITASDQGNGTTETLHGLIQTNADIQPGDSGGPLVNTRGQVIGMDTAASSNGTFTFQTPSTSGTEGFAIPVNRAITLAKQIEGGRSSSTVHIGATPFLGVEVTTPNVLYGGNASNGFGGFGGFGSSGPSGNSGATTPPTSSGAAIASVFPNTSAATAGLAEGDIIVGVDGKPVTSPANLTQDMLALHPGQRVSLAYVSPSAHHLSVTITLEAGPPQ